MRLYLGVGLLFIVGFYFINDSETVNNYLRLASGDPSGFRFLLFIGILKYGTLVTGLTLLAATSIYFALQLYKK